MKEYIKEKAVEVEFLVEKDFLKVYRRPEIAYITTAARYGLFCIDAGYLKDSSGFPVFFYFICRKI